MKLASALEGTDIIVYGFCDNDKRKIGIHIGEKPIILLNDLIICYAIIIRSPIRLII